MQKRRKKRINKLHNDIGKLKRTGHTEIQRNTNNEKCFRVRNPHGNRVA